MIRVLLVMVLLFGLSAIGPGTPAACAATAGAKSAAAAKPTTKKRKLSAKSVRKMKSAAQTKLDAAATKADRDMTDFLTQINVQRGMAQRMGNRFSLPDTPELTKLAHELMANSANSMRAMAVGRRATLREYAKANNIRLVRLRPRRAAPIALDPPVAANDTLAVPAVEIRPAKSALPPGGQPLAYQATSRRLDY